MNAFTQMALQLLEPTSDVFPINTKGLVVVSPGWGIEETDTLDQLCQLVRL